MFHNGLQIYGLFSITMYMGSGGNCDKMKITGPVQMCTHQAGQTRVASVTGSSIFHEKPWVYILM